MKRIKLFTLATATTLLFTNVLFGQTPNLGTSINYVLFTSAGAVGNTGISHVTGNVGTNM